MTCGTRSTNQAQFSLRATQAPSAQVGLPATHHPRVHLIDSACSRVSTVAAAAAHRLHSLVQARTLGQLAPSPHNDVRRELNFVLVHLRVLRALLEAAPTPEAPAAIRPFVTHAFLSIRHLFATMDWGPRTLAPRLSRDFWHVLWNVEGVAADDSAMPGIVSPGLVDVLVGAFVALTGDSVDGEQTASHDDYVRASREILVRLRTKIGVAPPMPSRAGEPALPEELGAGLGANLHR